MKTNATKLIKPDMLDTKTHWWDSFGRSEAEATARIFVITCKKAGSWTVTQAQLNEQDRSGDFVFNGLDKPEEGWFVKTDVKITATHRFVAYCYSLFPQ